MKKLFIIAALALYANAASSMSKPDANSALNLLMRDGGGGLSLSNENLTQTPADSDSRADLGEIANEKLALAKLNSTLNKRGIFVSLDAALLSVSPSYSLTLKTQQGKQKDSFGADTQGGRLAGEFGARLGYNFTLNHRLYLAYRYQSKTTAKGTTFHELGDKGNQFAVTTKAQSDAHKFVLGYDFLFRTFDENRAFVGLYGGFGLLKTKANSDTRTISAANMTHYPVLTDPSSINLSFKAFIIGLNAGHAFNLYKGNELEIGIRGEYVRGFEKESKVSSTMIFNTAGTSKRDLGTSPLKHNTSSFNAGIYALYSFNFGF